MKINETIISDEHPTYFIAEIGSNFDGSLSRAIDLICLAKECGANAVKFQHYTADTLVSDFGFSQLNNTSHQKKWKQSVSQTYRDAELNYEWTQKLVEAAKANNIDFFTSPYSFWLADYVEPYIPAYKIGSGDISWLEYLSYVSKKKKPILLATGASSMVEVEKAVRTVSENTKDLILMQCNTNYSADKTNSAFINLNVLKTFKEKYPWAVMGLSDHTQDNLSVLGAIAVGARVVEKHFTDTPLSDAAPDHAFSVNPDQ